MKDRKLRDVCLTLIRSKHWNGRKPLGRKRCFRHERAHRLLLETIGAAQSEGIEIDVVNTPYLNTIHPSEDPTYPGNLEIEKRIR